MPRERDAERENHFSVPIADIAPLLVRLTSAPLEKEEAPAVPELMEVEMKIAKEENPLDAGLQRIGRPSSFACPDCHGVLVIEREPLAAATQSRTVESPFSPTGFP